MDTVDSSEELDGRGIDGSWPSLVRRALADGAPLALGYVPFGFVFGAAVADSVVPGAVGLASSALIFAGAAQLAMVQLLDAGAAVPVVVATALVINARHLMYSGAIAPWFAPMPAWFRVAGPFVMADPIYSFAVVRFPQLPDDRARRRYWWLLGGGMLVAWTTLGVLGFLLGARVPEGLDLSLAVPLVFLALLVPTVVDRPTLAAAMTGGLVTVAADGLPLHLGLLVGALSGVVVGLALDGGDDEATGGRGAGT